MKVTIILAKSRRYKRVATTKNATDWHREWNKQTEKRTSMLLTVTVTFNLVPAEIDTVEASVEISKNVYVRPRPNG